MPITARISECNISLAFVTKTDSMMVVKILHITLNFKDRPIRQLTPHIYHRNNNTICPSSNRQFTSAHSTTSNITRCSIICSTSSLSFRSNRLSMTCSTPLRSEVLSLIKKCLELLNLFQMKWTNLDCLTRQHLSLSQMSTA